ncbi:MULTISPECIES: hypothetical protein [Butyricimonas]|uniref:hypothetical protein n=1 Tax=Butyricimonas TaxID=574697 RepID=UPI0013A5F41F|nr:MULTISPECIES: hypothetical protein [Butyricimonas]
MVYKKSGKLKSSWNPFMDDTQVIYADQLRYKNIEGIHEKQGGNDFPGNQG